LRQGARHGQVVDPQLLDRRLRQHARLQAVQGIVEALPQTLTAEGAGDPCRCRCAVRRLQLDQAVFGIGLPAPDIDQLAEQLVLQPGFAQVVQLALAAPVGTTEQRAGGRQQQGEGAKPSRQDLLTGQQGGHDGGGEQGQRQHRQARNDSVDAGRRGIGCTFARHCTDCTDADRAGRPVLAGTIKFPARAPIARTDTSARTIGKVSICKVLHRHEGPPRTRLHACCRAFSIDAAWLPRHAPVAAARISSCRRPALHDGSLT